MYHHTSIYCILPPHILRSIAERGTDEQRRSALSALDFDHAVRLRRATAPPMAALAVALPRKKVRNVYTAGGAEALPGVLKRGEGQPPSGDAATDEAYDGLGATFDFFWDACQRNSIDNQGLALDASVHFGQGYQNAFWNGRQMVFGDGDGDLFNRFTVSLDVIGHELTHGVTACELKLEYLDQAGALNESLSDVFGSLVKQYALKQSADQADWLIGAGLFTAKVHGKALRSMSSPGTAFDDPVLGKDPQPDKMADFVYTTRDNGGVHINSGIPNRAFYLVASKMGGPAWEKAGRIWYETLRDSSLRPDAPFSAFAASTAASAAKLFGDKEKEVVRTSWSEVGIAIS